MKQIYLTKKINEIVSMILILLGLKKESIGLSTTSTSKSLINFDSRNSFGLYSFKAALVLLVVVFSSSFSSYGQTIFTQNFDGAWTTASSLSPAWSSVGTTNNQWQMNTFTTGWSSTSGSYSPTGALSTSQSARFHTYDSSSATTGDLITPTLNFSTFANSKLLSFYVINTSGTDNLTVAISTDGGTTYGSALATIGVSAAWTQYSINIGTTISSTVKIRFRATSDFGTTDIGLDQVTLTNFTPINFSGTYTVNNTASTAGTNFNNFTDLVNALNNGTVTGATTINVSAGQTFAEIPPALIATGTSSNTITIQRSGSGANPKLTPTGIGSLDSGFTISGGDYITFDGIDVDASSATTSTNAIEFGYLIRNASATNGAQFNTIKNCAITLNKNFVTTTLCGCIYSSVSTSQGGVVPTAATGANSNNSYYNLTLSNAQNGIYLVGNTSFPDLTNLIGVSGSGCQTARNTISNIGGIYTFAAAYGVFVSGGSGTKIFNNDISNIRSNQAAGAGILLASYAGTSEIYNNKVSDVANSGSTSSTTRAVGIELQNSTGTPTVRVYNNYIYNITSPFTGTATASIYAYGIFANNTSTATIAQIDNNNIYLGVASGTPTYSSACFAIASSSAVHQVRGNIFVNAFPAQGATARHWCWKSTSNTTIGAATSVSNYNDMFVTNDANTSGFVGGGSSTNYSLSAWTTAVAQDANSQIVDPAFASTSNLATGNALLSAVSGFTPQTWVANDIICVDRSTKTPSDIGAFAFDPPATPTISSFTPISLCAQGGQTVTITGTNFVGITAVKFNGVNAASYSVVSSTSITAVVPVGVTDGTISVTNSGTGTSGSAYTAAPTPTVGVSSGSTTCASVATSLTATGAATYSWSPSTALSATTGATVTASPTATTTYTVTGTSAAGCTATNTVTITISPTPTALTVTKNPTAICYGGITTLTATGGQVATAGTVGTVGTGLLQTTATSQPTAFDNRWSNDWRQTIYTAADLTAAGLSAGNITSLAYNVTTLGDAATNANLNIKIGSTALSTFPSTSYVSTTGFTNVYGPSTYTHTATGWQTITFTTPYVWDGVSNIVVHVTMDGANATNNTITYYTATAGNTTIYTTSGYTAGTTTTGSLSTTRLDTRFVGTGLSNGSVIWTNTTDLYSNAAATTAYAGENLRVVYSKNTNTQTYTVSATLGSCSSTGSATVTPNALPTIAASSATTCSGGAGATLTATGGATYAWSPATGLSATTGSSVTATPTATTTYTVTGTDANGCVNTTTSVVTVNTPVAITTQPAGAVVLAGQSASFTVAATGTGLTYQWQENSGSGFANISGATSATYTISSTTVSQNNNIYQCIVYGTAPCGSLTTTTATLSVGSVSITTQPAAQTVCSNTSATFTIVASGSVASYQWESSTNGTSWTAISGATTDTLVLSGLTAAANSGIFYHCILNSGAVTSNSALLTVRDVVAIGTQPANQSVCAGVASVAFSTVATGSGLTYQWQVSTNGTTWNNVSGATAATYTINTPTGALNNNQYKVIVTGTAPCGPVTSNAVTLTVTDVNVASSAASICIGAPVTLSATFTGTPGSPTTSWVCATTGSGAETAVSGNTATVTPTAAGTYVYTFASNGSCPFSKTVSVTVNPKPIVTSATATPATVCSGAAISLAAASIANGNGTAALGAGSLTSSSVGISLLPGFWGGAKTQYLIKASELTALGFAAGNLTSVAFEPTDSGQTYQGFFVSIAATTATTLSSTFLANGTQVYAGTLTDNGFTPVANTVNTLSFGTGSGSASSFAWDGTSNIVLTFSWSRVPSATTSTATTMKYDTASFVCTTYKQADSLTPAAMLAQTAGTTTSTRPRFTFGGVLATNFASTYTWSWNSSPSVTTVTGTTSVTNTTAAAISQTFTATATNTFGCSSALTTAAIAVNAAIVAPTAINSTQCGAGTPTCSVTGSGISGNKYKWYLVATNGTALSGQIASALVSYPISATTTFYVSEVSADGLCEGPRVAVTATVTTPFAFSLSASTATNCSGSASLTPVTIATNGGYTSYSWSPATGVSGNSTTGWTFSPTTSTSYTVTATGGGCGTTATVAVTTTALPIVNAAASPAAICVGASSTITATTNVTGAGTVVLGAGASTSSSSGSSMFPGSYGGAKTQFIIKASELSAAGLSAGNITSLNFEATTAFSGYEGFALNIGNTTVSTASMPMITTGLTQVYSGTGTNGAYATTIGVNTLAFSSPFNWDGTSNIILSFCWAKNPTATSTTATTVKTDSPGFTCSVYGLKDSTIASTMCPFSASTDFGTSGTGTSRPKFTFAGQTTVQGAGTLAYTWNDPSATTGNVLTVSPSATTTYTVYGLNGTTGCTGTATAIVTVYTPPTAPSVTSATQCGVGIPKIAVADTNGYTTPTFKWYADNITTTALQTSTSTTYTSSVSVNTTFYVSVVSPGGCESGRTPVTTTIVTPATVTVSAAAAVCTGGSTTLTASGAVSYSWTPALGLNGTTSASVIATPSASTTYSVTGVDTNGCSTAVKTIAVTVNVYPSALSITQGASSICTNSVMSLTATGGTISGNSTILTENFNNSAPNWTITNGSSSPVVSNWVFQSAPLTDTSGSATFLNFSTTNGGKFAYANPDAGGSGSVTNTVLTSPTFSTVGYTSANLTFEQVFQTWSSDSTVKVEISADGGSTWSQLASYLGTSQGTTTTNAQATTNASVSLASYLNQSNLKIRYNYVSTWGYYWIIDNVAISGIGSIPTTTTWSPTTDLYSNSGATTAYAGANASVVYTKPSGNITYTATASNGACSVTATTNVAPVALPAFTLTNNVAICNGTATTLTTSGSGYTYVWSPATGLSATTGASVSASPTVTTTYTVEATDTTSGCKATKSVTVTVNNPGAILTTGTTVSQVVVPGQSTTFNVATASGATYSYQWQVNDGSGFVNLANTGYYSGVTTSTLTVSNIDLSLNNYQYQCNVTGAAPCATLTPIVATLSVSDTGFATQPADVTLCGASSTSFSVTTSGDSPYGIVWQMSTDNGVSFNDIADGTDAATGLTFTGTDQLTLNVSGITLANSGVKFTCTLNFALVSNPATLTIKTPVTITAQPSNQSVCVNGGTATFTAAATGSELAYQWQFSTNGTTWSNYTGAGATTASISIVNPALAANGTQYKLIVSGNAACSTATSSVATLNINNPTITSQPAAASVLIGSTATFTVAASAATSYQWQRAATLAGTYSNVTDATPTGNTYSGANSATLSVNTSMATAVGNANFYKCVVTNSGCVVTSNAAQLTTADYCASAATSSSDEDITNVTIGTLNNTTACASLTGSQGNATGTANLYSNFRASVAAPSLQAGSTQSISVEITECATFAYSHDVRVYFDFNHNGLLTDAGEEFVIWSLASSNTHTITANIQVPVTALTGNTIMRVVCKESISTPCGASSYGETEDYTVYLTPPAACTGTPTAGTASVSNTTVCTGNATTIALTGSSSTVTGISYQWYYSANGTSYSPVSGATTTSLATGVLTADAHYYCTVTCTNSGLSANSNTIDISVSNPLITGSTPAGRCGTGTVTLGATANAGSTINWYAALNGGASLASGASFTTPSISASTTYYAEASAGSLSQTSSNGAPTSTTTTVNTGLVLDVNIAAILTSLDVYSTSAGTVTMKLVNSAGTTIAGPTSGTVTASTLTNPQTINLGWSIPVGTGYKILVTSQTGALGYHTGTFPSALGNGVGNIVNGATSTGTTTLNYFLYNLRTTTGCRSSRTAVTATVDPTPTATISYAGSPYCNNAAIGSVTLTGTNAYTGGAFTAASGLGLNGTTGAINPTTSTPGTYTVTYTTNATTYCTPQTATTTVVINESVLTSNFSYAAASYCTNSGTVTPTVTGTAGVFTASPSGLSINATTGAINATTSTPGSYTVTNTVTACSNNSTSTFALVVYPAVTIGTQPSSATVCAGSNASITVAATGTSVVYQWQMSTNGTTWSNVSNGGAYSGATAATLAITGATNPMNGYQFRALVSDANPCGAVTSSVATLTVSQPTTPVITPSASNVCTGGTVALTVDSGIVSAFSNNFDTLPSNFTTSGTGVSATLNTTYQSEGTGSVLINGGVSADVAYSMNTNLNLSSVTNAQLTFSHQALMEGPTTSYDYGYVQYSADGGTTWTSFPTTSYTGSGTLFNSVVSFSTKSYPDWITAFTGTTSLPSNSLWKTETITIPAAALTSQFRLRFRYTTDSTVNYYGWLIDNVKVSTPNSVAWSPSTGLYTNAGATTAYTGGNVATVYAKPTASTTYTVTNANTLGCTNSSTVAVTVLAPATLSSIAQPAITCSGAQTTFALTGLLANSTSTLSYNINGGSSQTLTGVVADASGNATFTLALAGFTNGQTLTVTSITRTDLTPSCSTTITANNTVVIAVRPLVTYYADADGDGFGNYSAPQITCQGQPSGYVTNSTDCNDADATMNATYSFYADADADGYGAGSAVSLCAVNATTPPSGYSVNNTDCNDADATKHASFTFYTDADGDGYGAGSLVSVCAVNATTPPAGYSVNNTDCNDSLASINAHVTNSTAVTACGSYTWSVNGTSYSTSGSYTYEVDSCHTAVLNLTMSCSSVVNLKLNIQGYYDATTHAMRPVLANEGVGSSTTDVDNVTVELHNATTNALVTTTTAMLQTNGTAVATFVPAISGSFYLVVKHRNALETWSSATQNVGPTPVTYDFTTAANKAYGSNMIQLESGVYGFYSGDLNQDGFIEGTDYDSLNSDTAASAIGYFVTDLNGDGFVDGLDYDYLNANVSDSVITNHP